MPSTARELRDHTMVVMLIGCGLRRAELLALRLGCFQQREEHWVIADLVGKGGQVRTVPIPAWVKRHIDAWSAAAVVTDGTVFRAISKAGRVWGDGMSPKVLWDVVRAAATRAGIEKLARTTCGAPAPGFATSRVASWIRSNSCSATSPSRRPSASSDASRSSGLR
jgi:integrase